MTKTFLLDEIISVYSGILVSRSHMDGIYRVCEFMAGTPVFTHQLPRVSEAIHDEIGKQLPFIKDIVVPKDMKTKDGIFEWVDRQILKHGKHHPLTYIEGLVEDKNPIDEAQAIISRCAKA